MKRQGDDLLALRGRTLVIADLHLRPTIMEEDRYLLSSIGDAIDVTDAETLVFAGDTFELSFVESDGRTHRQVLRSILDAHGVGLRGVLQRGRLRKVVFLIGDHDFRLTECCDELPRSLACDAEVSVGEFAYHKESKVVVLHGHQFDLNRIVRGSIGRVLTEELGNIFDRFIYTQSERSLRFDRACKHGLFSFWYSEGKLADYIEALCAVFGYQGQEFWARCRELIRSDFYQSWSSSLSAPLARMLAKISRFGSARGVSGFGKFAASKVSRWLFTVGLLELASACRLGGCSVSFRGLLPSRPSGIVAGHLHRPLRRRYWSRTDGLVVATPRWHVSMYKEGVVSLQRHGAMAVIDTSGLQSQEWCCETKLISSELIQEGW